jgi:putative transposase
MPECPDGQTARAHSSALAAPSSLSSYSRVRITAAAETYLGRRQLSDNRSSYVAGDLADFLQDKGMDHVRGTPHHPQTQGKIERWHQIMKNNRILLENDYLPGDLERQIEAFVDYCNNRRYHESLGNLTPADVSHGRGVQILKMREEIKTQTIQKRRLHHRSAAA